jgi:hypothetical protein
MTLADTQREHLRARTDRWLLSPKKVSEADYDESLPFFACKLHFHDKQLQEEKKIFDELMEALYDAMEDFHWRPIVRAVDFLNFSQEYIWPSFPLHNAGFFFPSPSDIVRHIPGSGIRTINKRKTEEMSPEAQLGHWENWALQFLLAQLREGRIRWFRRCAKCQNWFLAMKESQKFCGDDCRKKYASQGEQFKERRRIYMQDYRRQEKARDLKAQQLSRRNSAKQR